MDALQSVARLLALARIKLFGILLAEIADEESDAPAGDLLTVVETISDLETQLLRSRTARRNSLTIAANAVKSPRKRSPRPGLAAQVEPQTPAVPPIDQAPGSEGA